MEWRSEELLYQMLSSPVKYRRIDSMREPLPKWLTDKCKLKARGPREFGLANFIRLINEKKKGIHTRSSHIDDIQGSGDGYFGDADENHGEATAYYAGQDDVSGDFYIGIHAYGFLHHYKVSSNKSKLSFKGDEAFRAAKQVLKEYNNSTHVLNVITIAYDLGRRPTDLVSLLNAVDFEKSINVFVGLKGFRCQPRSFYQKFPNRGLVLDRKYSDKLDRVELTIIAHLLTYLDMGLLELSRCKIDLAGVNALFDVLRSNKVLNNLILSGNSLTNEGVAALAEALKVMVLTTLQLEKNEIGDKGTAALAEVLRVNKKLTTLNLFSNKIEDAGALADALKVNAVLNNLDLGSNTIGPTGATALADALKVNAALTSLNLSGVDGGNIGDAGAAALADALKVNAVLKELNLRSNGIGPTGAFRLSQALRVNAVLNFLCLGGNSIDPTGAAHLAKALKSNAVLTELNLGENQIGAEGAAALGEALKVNAALTQLFLRDNQIGDAGATYISYALKLNVVLKFLDLRNNAIGDNGASALAESLIRRFKGAAREEPALELLWLGGNRIGDEGAKDFADALRLNTNLKELNLDDNNIRDRGAESLADALGSNYGLKHLNMQKNPINVLGRYSLKEAVRWNEVMGLSIDYDDF